MTTELYLSYASSTHTIREPDPDDDWDNGEEEGEYWVTGVSLTPGFKDYYMSNEDIKLGDEVYVTYCSYGDGDTFGTYGGHGEIIAVSKVPQLAYQARDFMLEENDFNPNYATDTQKKKWPTSLPYPKFFNCRGYFAWGQQYRVEKFTVTE